MAYQRFDFLSVVEACGIPIKRRTLNATEVQCRCPFCEDNKYHLYINREKETWHCCRCGAGGYYVIPFFARLSGVDNRTAYRMLCDGQYPYNPKLHPAQKAAIRQEDVQPLGMRHDVYYDMLSLLRLEQPHCANLMRRGLTQQEILANKYKSLPASQEHRAFVTRTLAERYDLAGIPGFYPKDGHWQMAAYRSGFLVPVLDCNGYIQGLQIRHDKAAKHKYEWFSSSRYDGGTAACSWIHVTGDTTQTTAYLTEGPLKADISSLRAKGQLFLGLPGAHSMAQLGRTLEALPNVHTVVLAFDQDKAENEVVLQAQGRARDIVQSMGRKAIIYDWHGFKGIDDYTVFKSQPTYYLHGERLAA